MDIINLLPGEKAPDDVDCVHIERTDEGKYRINCSALLSCGDGDEVESVAVIGSEVYGSFADAESAGLAWAAGQCVERLYVSRSE